MRVAAVQLNSTAEKARNLATAERLVRAAAADGAELVALPEKWNLLADGEQLLAGAEPLDGPSLGAAREHEALRHLRSDQVVLIGRDGYRSKNGDDRHDDHQFDQGETGGRVLA